jgi:hypothetical protein
LCRTAGVVLAARVAIPNGHGRVATADVKISLLPLQGNAEVQAITVERPQVDVWISPAAGRSKAKKESSQPAIPLALYRSVMRRVLDAAARFAPATTVAIADGRVAWHLFDLPPLEASKLNLRLVTDGKGSRASTRLRPAPIGIAPRLRAALSFPTCVRA